MKPSPSLSTSLLVTLWALVCPFAVQAVTTVFVSDGVPLSVVYNPTTATWTTNTGYLEKTGTGNFLFGGQNAGPNDFHIYSRLSLNINATAAAFCFNTDSHFGFDSGSRTLFYEGPLLGTTTVSLGAATNYFQSGVPFDFEVVRTSGTNVSFLINGTNVFTYTKFTTADPGQIGFRPWRATMDLYSFSISQPLVIQILQPLPGTNSLGYNPAAGFSFAVLSDASVATSGIQVIFNGQDMSSQVTYTGSATHWTGTMALQPNVNYNGQIVVSNALGLKFSTPVAFDTFTQNLQTIEAEDYDFSGGQFIDNVVLSSTAGPSNYLDRQAVAGVDVNMVKAPATTLYRIGDLVTTAVAGDYTRPAYQAAIAVDPGVADYYIGAQLQDNWLNYTRTIPTGLYNVFVRAAKTGTPAFTATLGVVTSGAGTTSQTVSPLGVFTGPATTGAQVYEYVQLGDVFGNPVTLPLGGVTTLRFTPLNGAPLLNLNYFLLAPQSAASQPPFVSSISPAPWASSNVITTPLIGATILNGTTTVTPASVHLFLDASEVTGASTVSPSATGLQVSYQVPTALTLGQHKVRMTYSDSAAATFTNQWSFVAANQAVLGYWQFLEGTASGSVSTNPGAILDTSGNGRNGTAMNTGMVYVAGSPSFGGTPAMHFSRSADMVQVPDPSGVFNFRGGVTFEAVIRTTNTATTPAILAKNAGSTSEGEYWWRAPGVAGGKMRIDYNDGRNPAIFVPGTNTINDGQWHHLAAVLDPVQQQVRFYVDYSPEALTNNVSLPGIIGWTANLALGNFLNASSVFNGDINLIRISSSALDVSQFVHPTAALLPYIVPVSPVPGDQNVSPGQMVKATIVNRTTAAVLSTVRLSLDSVAVPTNQVVITPNATGADLSWPLPGSLAAGTHTLSVSCRDNGQPSTVISNAWSFQVPVNPLVRGYWQFDEQLPNGAAASLDLGVIRDLSSNGRNLTAFGSPAPLYTPSSGVYGSPAALHFAAGALDAVRAGPSFAPAFNFGNGDSFTLEASIRINPPGSGGNQAIVSKDWAANVPCWWFRVQGGIVRFLISQNGGPDTAVAGTTLVNDGAWHHVAAVRDATNRVLNVYVDYQLDGQVADPTTDTQANDQDMTIGAFNLIEPGRDFLGDIDFVRISAAALTPDQFLKRGAPVMWNIGVTSGRLQFSFQTTSGATYTIQQTAGLESPAWVDIETTVGDGTVFTRSYATTGVKSFFRVKQTSP